MVIVDCLGKGVILEPLEKLDTDYVARRFIKCFVGHHGIPSAITSDRGINELCGRICELLGMIESNADCPLPDRKGRFHDGAAI
jgi:hypothetical protein